MIPEEIGRTELVVVTVCVAVVALAVGLSWDVIVETAWRVLAWVLIVAGATGVGALVWLVWPALTQSTV